MFPGVRTLHRETPFVNTGKIIDGLNLYTGFPREQSDANGLHDIVERKNFCCCCWSLQAGSRKFDRYSLKR